MKGTPEKLEGVEEGVEIIQVQYLCAKLLN